MAERTLDDPVQERRRLAALEHIRQFPDPVLRSIALPVTAFDQALREEVELMIRIMIDGRGVGLAAPQIGRSRRVIVVRPEDDGPVRAFLNPAIAWSSKDTDTVSEGCLSIGEVTVDVVRPVAVRLIARGVEGEEMEIDAEGYSARVIQHEIDHLDGVLMLDRTSADERRRALRELRTGSSGP